MPQVVITGSPIPSPPASPTPDPTASPGAAGGGGSSTQQRRRVIITGTPIPQVTTQPNPTPSPAQTYRAHARAYATLTYHQEQPPAALQALEGFMQGVQDHIAGPTESFMKGLLYRTAPGIAEAPGAGSLEPVGAAALQSAQDILQSPFVLGSIWGRSQRSTSGSSAPPLIRFMASPEGRNLANIWRSPALSVGEKIDTTYEIFGFNAHTDPQTLQAQGITIPSDLDYMAQQPGLQYTFQQIDRAFRNPQIRRQFGLGGLHQIHNDAALLTDILFAARASWAQWKEHLPMISGAETTAAMMLVPVPGLEEAGGAVRAAGRIVGHARPFVNGTGDALVRMATRIPGGMDMLRMSVKPFKAVGRYSSASMRSARNVATYIQTANPLGDRYYQMMHHLGVEGSNLHAGMVRELVRFGNKTANSLRTADYFGDLSPQQMMELMYAYEKVGTPDANGIMRSAPPEWRVPINGASIVDRVNNLRRDMVESDAEIDPGNFPATHQRLIGMQQVYDKSGKATLVPTFFPRNGIMNRVTTQFFGEGTRNFSSIPARKYATLDDLMAGLGKGDMYAGVQVLQKEINQRFLPAVTYATRRIVKHNYAAIVKGIRQGETMIGRDGKPMVRPISYTFRPTEAMRNISKRNGEPAFDSSMYTFGGKDKSPYEAYQDLQNFVKAAAPLTSALFGGSIARAMAEMKYMAMAGFAKDAEGYYLHAAEDFHIPDVAGYAVKPEYLEALIDANPSFRHLLGEAQRVTPMSFAQRIEARDALDRTGRGNDPWILRFDLTDPNEGFEDALNRQGVYAMADEISSVGIRSHLLEEINDHVQADNGLLGPSSRAAVRQQGAFALEDEFGPAGSPGSVEFGQPDAWDKIKGGALSTANIYRSAKLMGSPAWHFYKNSMWNGVRAAWRLANGNPAKMLHYYSLLGFGMGIASKEMVRESAEMLGRTAEASGLLERTAFPLVALTRAGRKIPVVGKPNVVSDWVDHFDIPQRWLDEADQANVLPPGYGTGMRSTAAFMRLMSVPFSDLSFPQTIYRSFISARNFGQHLTFNVMEGRVTAIVHHIAKDLEKMKPEEAADFTRRHMTDYENLSAMERKLGLQSWLMFYNFWKWQLKMAAAYWVKHPQFNLALRGGLQNENAVAGNPAGGGGVTETLGKAPGGGFQETSVGPAPIRYAMREGQLMSGGPAAMNAAIELTGISELFPPGELAMRAVATAAAYKNRQTGMTPEPYNALSPLWDIQADPATDIVQFGQSLLGMIAPYTWAGNSWVTNAKGSPQAKGSGIARALREHMFQVPQDEKAQAMQYIEELENNDDTHYGDAQRLLRQSEGMGRSSIYRGLRPSLGIPRLP
jgi:hypothetical protein